MRLCDENKLVGGLNLRHFLFRQRGATEVRDIMQQLFTLYDQKKIKPAVDSTYAMEDVYDAMKLLHDRKNIGKVLLCPAQVPRPRTIQQQVSETNSAGTGSVGGTTNHSAGTGTLILGMVRRAFSQDHGNGHTSAPNSPPYIKVETTTTMITDTAENNASPSNETL